MYEYPRWIVFQLLEQCNLRCKMCYEWGENGSYFEKKDLKQLDIEVVKRVIQECSVVNPYFELFGGEPLLYPHIEEVLYEINKANCKVDIPTNGTLLSQYTDILLKYPPKRIWVSIDGPEEYNDSQRGKGVFQKAINGVKKLHEEKLKRGSKYPEIGATMVVTPDNYLAIEQLFRNELNPEMFDWFSIEFQLYITDDIYSKYRQLLKKEFNISESLCAKGLVRNPDMFKTIDIDKLISQINIIKKHCSENNINLIGYPKVIEADNLKSFYSAHWDKMAERKKHCSLPWVYAEISATGNVSNCHTFYDYSIGNINNNTMKEIWNGEEAKKYRKVIKKNMLPICVACSRYYSDI